MNNEKKIKELRAVAVANFSIAVSIIAISAGLSGSGNFNVWNLLPATIALVNVIAGGILLGKIKKLDK